MPWDSLETRENFKQAMVRGQKAGSNSAHRYTVDASRGTPKVHDDGSPACDTPVFHNEDFCHCALAAGALDLLKNGTLGEVDEEHWATVTKAIIYDWLGEDAKANVDAFASALGSLFGLDTEESGYVSSAAVGELLNYGSFETIDSIPVKDQLVPVEGSK